LLSVYQYIRFTAIPIEKNQMVIRRRIREMLVKVLHVVVAVVVDVDDICV